jgi:hypothetical protein
MRAVKMPSSYLASYEFVSIPRIPITYTVGRNVTYIIIKIIMYVNMAY